MVRNIRGHRIRWSRLLAQGALAGVIASAVMLAVAMVTVPLLADTSDGWTFLKVVASSVMGNSAADPLTGFEAGPVVVGLLLHLVMSVLAGVVYAGLVGVFDLEGWTPVAVMGLLFGGILFVWSATFFSIGVTANSADSAVPLAAMFWGNVSFGLAMGVVLATWAERADLDRDEDQVRVRAFEGDERAGQDLR